MKSFAELIDCYLTAYCEPNPSSRARLIAATWTSDGVLIDPPLTARGHEELTQQADALLSLYPGAKFQRTSELDMHQGYARYSWDLIASSGERLISGFDVAQQSPDGKLSMVIGFFGPLKQIEDAGA